MYSLAEMGAEVGAQETFLRGELGKQFCLAEVKQGLILALDIEVCSGIILILGERSEPTPPLMLESAFPVRAAVRAPPEPCGDQRT